MQGNACQRGESGVLRRSEEVPLGVDVKKAFMTPQVCRAARQAQEPPEALAPALLR